MTNFGDGRAVSVTRTTDPPVGIVLSLRRDGDGFIVTDAVGIRYGSGTTFGEALAMWADCVQDCCDEPLEKLGEPYLGECKRYRSALLVAPPEKPE